MKLRVAAVAFVIAASSVAAPAVGDAAGCGITWGSTPKVAAVQAGPPMFNVRAGRHDCYDRLVVDVRGRVRGFNVRYVPAVTHIASGQRVPLRGGAFLEV